MDNSQGQRHNINRCFRRFFQALIKDFPDNARLTWDGCGSGRVQGSKENDGAAELATTAENKNSSVLLQLIGPY